MFWRWLLKTHTIRASAIDAPAAEAIREAVLASPYMAANNLNRRFAGTYGFSIVFKREAIDEVRAAFPAFAPFLDLALLPEANAFFLNPLLIADGAGVEPHRDKSLHSYTEAAGFPVAVSVLYVAVPEGLDGGRLRLYRGDGVAAEVTPEERSLVTFRGDLRHEVSCVSAGAPDLYAARLSLVVEQYRVPRRALAALPRMHVGTRREAAIAPLADGPGEGAFGDAVRRCLEGADRLS